MRLDGQDIHFLDRRWFRRQIGIVHRNPEFFSTSVAENIAYGREGCSTEEVEQAAKDAGADGFIKALPHVSFFYLFVFIYFSALCYIFINFLMQMLTTSRNIKPDIFLLQGYETILDDRGLPLTAYQKHLLALARALIRKPRILLWEEDLSFMDSSALDALIIYLDKVDLLVRTNVFTSSRLHLEAILILLSRSASFRMQIKLQVLKVTF